jgi:DNA repair protein RecO (recombination protein O)
VKDSSSTPAVVVRVVDYGESDRILTLLTRAHGKLGAMARGARKSKRRFGALLGMFAMGNATLRERPGADLAILEGWQPTSDPIGLATDVAKMAHAGYVCELTRELSAPRQADAPVFDLLAETLTALAERDRPVRVETLRVFELALLDALGLGPELEHCLSCGRDDLAEAGTRFDVARGGVVCGHCHGVGPELPERARRALLSARGVAPARAAAGELSLTDDVNAACREALGAAILHQLGRPLRSVEFIAKVRNPLP